MHIIFETLLGALEATRKTAIAAPTHLLNAMGVMTPKDIKYRPGERRGVRAKNIRVMTTYKGSTVDVEASPLDANEANFWFNMGMMPLATPSSTPTNGVLTRLWAYIRRMTVDDEKFATLFWGDPNVQVWRTAGNAMIEFTLENDAMADDGMLMFSAALEGGPLEEVADPVVPASIAGTTFPGAQMQAFVDTSSAIGTTAATNRILKSKLTVPTGRTLKRGGGGATSDKTYTHVGIEQTAPTLELTMEVNDTTEMDLWAAETVLKVRVRHNGSLIESVTPDYYNYVEHDIYGVLSEPTWGEYKGNRTITFKIEGQYDATLASDLRIGLQNERTSV